MKKKHKNLVIALIALALLFSVFQTFSIFQPGADAPIVSFLSLDSGKQLVQGQPVSGTWNGVWQNRIQSTYGGMNIAGAYFLDGRMVGLFPGNKLTFNGEVPSSQAWYGDVGIGTLFAYKTATFESLPVMAKLPYQGNTVSFSDSFSFSGAGLTKGFHRLEAKVFQLNSDSPPGSIFQCGSTVGACCFIQTNEQIEGYCPGLFGKIIQHTRPSQPACSSLGIIPTHMVLGTAYDCSGEDDPACRDQCCQKDWCGGGWCSSSAPGTTIYYYPYGMIAFCENGPNEVFGAWEESVVFERTNAKVDAMLLAEAETVASFDFEVVDSCQSECCVGETGIENKACGEGLVCQNNACITPLQDCPSECCQELSGFKNKACPSGQYCVNSACVFKPVPPSPPIWQVIISLIFDWLQKLFGLFFTISGPSNVLPGETHNYAMVLLAKMPDSDYSDGTIEYQFGNWALVDKYGNIVDQGEWKPVQGIYEETVSITVPQNLDNHALIGVINQYNMEFNFSSLQWETKSEDVVAKEGLNLQTGLPPPAAPIPVLDTLVNIILGIWNWILGILGLI